MTGKEKLQQIGRGFCMGCADIIPGVSGGTVALTLGIYERLVGSIKLMDAVLVRGVFTAHFWKLLWQGLWGNLPALPSDENQEDPVARRVEAALFIGFLVLGILTAIAAAAKVITMARDGYPEVTRGFFFGLVAASVKVPLGYMKRHTVKDYVALVLFTVGTWLLLGLGQVDVKELSLLYVFFGGAVAICAMILPGISGAFILLMLGIYDPVLRAVKEFVYDQQVAGLPMLFVLVAGIIVGIVSFSRLLHYLLKHHHDITMGALVGLMLGSLRVLWPWQNVLGVDGPKPGAVENVLPAAMDGTLVATVGFFLLGVAIVVVLEQIGKAHEAKSKAA